MNDTDDDGEKGLAWRDAENVQILDAHVTESEDGSFREQRQGEQFSEVFWSNAVTTTLHQTHPRVPQLKTELVCQYKFENDRIYVKTLRYKMTTRNGNQNRANIDVGLQAWEWKRLNSPDSMLQDTQWHAYDAYLDSPLGRLYQVEVSLAIRVDYDGRDNDVGQNEGWGTKIFPSQKPSIDSPVSDALVSMPFAVSGTKGLLGGTVKLLCLNNGNVTSLGSASVGSDGRWSASISLPSGVLSFYAEQVRGSENSGKSNTVTIRRYVAARIDSPANGAVVAAGSDVWLRGGGSSRTTIDIMPPGGAFLHATATTQSDGTWNALFNQSNYPHSSLVETQAAHRDMHDWSTKQSFTLLRPPPLTTHTANQEVEQQITVGGVLQGSIKSGTVNVYRDVTNTLLGSGNVLNTGGWEARISLIPGPYTVTANHVYSSVTSIRSAPLRLRVRPPPPSITSALNGETVTLSGTGYNGAGVRMDIHFSGNSVPYLDAAVSSGHWTKVLPVDLRPGNYRFGGRQSVSDGGSGRIFNTGWAVEVPVNVPTPAPTEVTATVNEQRATFRGRGRQWGTNAVKIGIYNNGVALVGVPQANVLPNLNWETTANADLAPGNYTALTARQLVNNQWSGNSASFSMIVSSPPPIFTEPPLTPPSGQRPRISGTAWPASAIILRIPGKPDVRLTATGGSFVLNASEDWAPATYTITATAAFGGQTSPVASWTFTVKTPPPVITTAANAEVDLSPVLEGRGFKGCWVVIYSNVTHLPLGAGPVGQDNKWEVTLTEQVPANLTVYAIQQESQSSSNMSDRTDVRTVRVRVPKPVITVPAQNGKPARESLFSGTGQYPGTVELSIKGQGQPFLKDIEVKADGTWEAKVRLPAGGPVTLEARQRQRTYASDPFERVVTVVPAVPVVDTPRSGEALGGMLTISGYGYQGDTISVYRRGKRVGFLKNTTVSEAGTWSVSLAHGMLDPDEVVEPEGISALASAGAGLDSVLSPILYFLLLKPAPKITEPLAGDWVGVRPLFSGLATPGASITVASWFNTDDVLAPATIADAHGRWAVTGNKDLREGAMRVVVRQTVGDTPSEWFESGRFMVERKTAEFEAPAVHYPLVGHEVGRWPMFSGTGEPGAEVLIVKQNAMGTVLGRTRVDRNGRWALRSQIELPVANTPYGCSVRQSRDGAISKWLLPHHSLVVTQVAAGFEKPVIDIPVDDATQVLERYPLFAGRGVPGAELKVYQHDEGTVLAITRVDAEGNWSVRNQVGLSLGGHRISTQQNMDGQLSAWSSTVSFKVEEKLDKPVFTYPSQNAQVSPHAVIRGTALPGGEVRLYKSGNPHKVWGHGVADEQGQWVIVTDALPVGDFRIGGRVYKGDGFSPWMTELLLKVSDIG